MRRRSPGRAGARDSESDGLTGGPAAAAVAEPDIVLSKLDSASARSESETRLLVPHLQVAQVILGNIETNLNIPQYSVSELDSESETRLLVPHLQVAQVILGNILRTQSAS